MSVLTIELGKLTVSTNQNYYLYMENITVHSIPSSTMLTEGKFTLSLDKVNDSLAERVANIEERLCILPQPSPDILERHVALRNAYNEYKVLEKLILGDQK